MLRPGHLFLLAPTFTILACASQAPPPAETQGEPASGSEAPSSTPPAETPAALTPEACRAQSGEVFTDKGDGSLHAQGCPDGRPNLGAVRIGIEGGLCCGAAPATPQKPAGKRAPCTKGADQTCNADPAASAIWGHCTDLGVCECKTGFKLNPGGYCEPAK